MSSQKNTLRANLNRQFLLKRSIPQHIVKDILAFRPIIRRPINEWTLIIVIYFLKHYSDNITLTFRTNDPFRVRIGTHPHYTTLSMINDENIIYFRERFPSASKYPATPVLRLLYKILSTFRLNIDFSPYSDLLVIHQEELKHEIPKTRLYWSRIKNVPSKISPEEQSFLSYIESVHPQQHASVTTCTLHEYLQLFPTITLQQAMYWQAQAHDFL